MKQPLARFSVALCLIIGFVLPLFAETLEVRLRLRNDKSDETVVNRENLTRIKQFILAQGKRETYCNMYNNNPAHETQNYHFYLNPDSEQANINCETNKSDFQTMVIRVSALAGKKNQYRHVVFANPNEVQVVASWPSADLTVSAVKDVVVDALKEILAEIDKTKPNCQLPAAASHLEDKPKSQQ